MASDSDLKNAIQQITAVKSLLRTETVNGVTLVKRADAELGEFETIDGIVIAKRYGHNGMEKDSFKFESEAIDWITEIR